MTICVNLGCGDSKACPIEKGETWINLDMSANNNADVVADLEDGLPFKNESVDVLYASHVMEHIHKFPELMQECYRVLKPRGLLHIKVPDAGCRAAIADPTHYRYFVPETFYHFDEDSMIGFDTLGMRRMGFWLKWIEVIKWRRAGLDNGCPGTYFTEIIVDYEKKGEPHPWEKRLLELASENSNNSTGTSSGGWVLDNTNPSPLG
jgi:SAM-dependent methyltransferase